MARYSRHPEMQDVAFHLSSIGHNVTSRWIWGTHQATDEAIGTGTITEFERRLAQEDIDDLTNADMCIGFSEPLRTASRGGRHVEFGMALALGKILVVVGGYEHVFHALPQVRHVKDTKALFAAIRSGLGAVLVKTEIESIGE